MEAAANLIDETRRLLDGGRSWVQGRLAVDGDGRPVRADDPAACKFCLLGALQRGCRDDARMLAAALDAVTDVVNSFWPSAKATRRPVSWQDRAERTWAEVDRVLEEAAARLRAAA